MDDLFAARPSPDQFAAAGWDDILPWYERLAAAPLDATNAEAWLTAWSALSESLTEAAELAWIAYTCDTGNAAKEAAHLRWAGEIAPRRHEQDVRLSARLLVTGWSRPDLEPTLRRFRNQHDLFRAENVPLLQEIEDLNARYMAIAGGMTAEWEGETLPLPLLAPFVLDPDRAVRERAYRLRNEPYIAAREELAGIFDRLYALRQRLATNASLADHRAYAFRLLDRFDYGPADCAAFHDAVAATVVPLLARRRERRREQLGVESLRPWDIGVDPLGRPPLRPYAGADDLIARARAAFTSLDPALGGHVATMANEGLLDLDTRPGKLPAGYCATLPHRRRPFIYMTGAGIADDVTTLVHEGGHAFHTFETATLPFVFQRDPGAEMGEVASMTMELLATPHLAQERGGFYGPNDLRRARAEHLDGVLRLLAGVSREDAFQHWIYTSGQGHDAAARDDAWRRLGDRFNPGIDWDGLDAERTIGWYDSPHIFMMPFYMIEYGLAQLAALQIWRASRDDEAGAVAAYRRALALGGTRPLPDLYATAGAKLTFDAATMAELVGTIADELERLDA
jgi:oligoendopeptidase F